MKTWQEYYKLITRDMVLKAIESSSDIIEDDKDDVFLIWDGEPSVPAKKLLRRAIELEFPDEEIDWNGSGEDSAREILVSLGFEVQDRSQNAMPDSQGRICSINDSIWLAAAVISYEKYYGEGLRNIEDFHLKQSDIRNRALKINDFNPEAARTSQWCCGDHNDHTYAYLHAIGKKRRLSFPSEFAGDKCEPTNIDKSIIVSTSQGDIPIQKIYDFVHKEYAKMADQVVANKVTQEHSTYGFDEIVSFLQDYAGEHYIDPEKAGDQKTYMDELKRRGKDAYQKFSTFGKKIAEQIPGLEYVSCSKWVNQGQTVDNYLTIALRKEEWKGYPNFVAISVNQHDPAFPGEGYYLSVRADTYDNNSEEKAYQRQKRLLDCTLRNGMSYMAKRKDGTYVFLGTDTENVKALCDDGTIRKLEIVEGIDDLPQKDADGTLFSEVLSAVREIYPLYEKVMKGNDRGALADEGTIEKKGKYGLNTILCGPPGTGKTYNSIRIAVSICEPGLNVDGMTYDDVLVKYNELKKDERIEFTTFHQSYGYEEFIEGIKPVTDDNQTKEIQYKVVPGLFKEFCKKARQVSSEEDLVEKETKPCVFIIDEINRGNISKIFGELITLIEVTKRDGAKEAMETTLPYSRDPFSVPDNVYILGTMNTADRSIALMDTALRRRFDFVEMMPDLKVIEGITITKDGETLDVSSMLKTINERIEYLYDREHTIGHAFFTRLRDDNSMECLADIFRNKILPLLQEYFYEDYEKIQLVLGDNDKSSAACKFVLDKKVNENTLFKKSPQLDLHENTYEIQKKAFDKIQSYIEITEKRNVEAQRE